MLCTETTTTNIGLWRSTLSFLFHAFIELLMVIKTIVDKALASF